MKISEITIDGSDTTVKKSKEYLRTLEFRSYHTGKPTRICGFCIQVKDRGALINFRDKNEVKKFTVWLNEIQELFKAMKR